LWAVGIGGQGFSPGGMFDRLARYVLGGLIFDLEPTMPGVFIS
jgi:hypothetical protein